MPSGSVSPVSNNQPSQPNYSQPPQPTGLPTQRVNIVPEAPRPPSQSASNKGVPVDPRVGNVYAGGAQWQNAQQIQNIPAPQPNVGTVRPPAPRPMTAQPRGREYEADMPKVWDTVTVVLAFLAFMSVVCLVPLYLIVITARLG
jgi:hypothetical protein